MSYIAHIRERDGAIQTVQEHLDEVSKLSARLGDKIGVRHLAGLAGCYMIWARTAKLLKITSRKLLLIRIIRPEGGAWIIQLQEANSSINYFTKGIALRLIN
ncbi:hypothetical protein J2TS4_19170 [Paenibacillus sp. J2TS4]|nr:hypothetical protein J2TS4_19170 [Paenibacillus sp. J2TS4]